MELKDIFLGLFYLIIIYGLAFLLRPKFTNKFTKKYFIPALTVKFFGAIALGLVYQFYYGNTKSGSGDTFLYFGQTKILYEAFFNSPKIWLELMLSSGEYKHQFYPYVSRLLWYSAPTEFIIIKIASLFSIISFHTYTVIALFFALISFTGMWQMYTTFLKLYPHLYKQLAIAIFFIPSVFFWGSGLLKDSLAIGALGWVFYGFYKLFIEKRDLVKTSIVLSIAVYALVSIKVYILLSFIPPALFWIINENKQQIKNKTLRILATPLALVLGVAIALFSAINIAEEDSKYDISNLGEQSKINSVYLSQQVYTGSAYDIGIFDGSMQSLLTVGPQAVIVALYRPFLWEVRNPVMLLSALESAFFIYLTLLFFFKVGFFKTLKFIISKPILTFCLLFSIILAFGVGTNSGNFGTLVRYKIPIMPFYLAALFIMKSYLKRPKKVRRLAVTA